MADELNAEGRVRLYAELSSRAGAHNVGWDTLYDARFKSKELPRSAYAMSLSDLEAVLAELDRLRALVGDR